MTPTPAALSPSPADLPPGWPQPGNRALPIVVFGVLPVCGLVAELLTGMLSEFLPLFPTWWHVGAVALAVLLNGALHDRLWRAPRHLLLRTLAVGYVLGLAGLYGLAEAPAIPIMAIMAVVGLGVLAAAPYWALLGMLRLLPDLWLRWTALGRSPRAMAGWLLVGALVPLAVLLREDLERLRLPFRMHELAVAMRDPTRAADEEALAAALRAASVPAQREVCLDGWAGDEEAPLGWMGGDTERFGHLGNGRQFWFLHRGARNAVTVDDARRAFHRAHGTAWDQDWHRIPGVDWNGGADIEWLQSRVNVRPAPDAALAAVDWELTVRSHRRRRDEARFEIQVPPGAVASALSLWIDGEERPAAFAGAAKVRQAYEQVVSKQRDPALLEEIAPGRLRLLLFPLASDLPPMKVSVGFTIPLRWAGTATTLQLPRIVDHNCGRGRVAQHERTLRGSDGATLAVDQLDDAGLRRPIELPRGRAVSWARDAEGIVVQRMVARTPSAASEGVVLVVDASASVGEAKPDWGKLLAAFPAAAPVSAFVAHGSGHGRRDGAAGDAALARWLGEQSFTGGCDASRALRAACEAAVARGLGRVVWLHGACPSLLADDVPIVPRRGTVLAVPLHPGRNVVREATGMLRALAATSPAGVDDGAVALAELVRYPIDDRGIGDFTRGYERASETPADAVAVSDQIARLWAAERARERFAAGDRDEAARLAARYRLVTAGAGAVVLENQQQYQQSGLDPGAEIGREPEGPIGSGPVPEASTFVLVATGLAAVWLLRGRRRQAVARV
jgi:hypothetical protein